VMGGCCGTDQRHIGAICEACIPPDSTLITPSAINRTVSTEARAS
jgi:hypothetical protein